MTVLAVSASGLVKRYGDVVAVAGVDLEIVKGECFGLLGPNGAGKTTTVEVVQGLLQPEEGTVELLGGTWRRHAASLRQRLGTQLQETVLADKLTVHETLRLFRSFYLQGNPVEAVLEMVQLREKQHTWVKNLSGGQRQRLAVGCALVGHPELLFLDEPTTGLDPQSRHQIWGIIDDFRRRGGTVVLTTHYMEEAERLCDRVAVIDHGRVIALGTPAELIASLGADHVIQFALADGILLDEATLSGLPGVQKVRLENGRGRLTVRRIHETVPALIHVIGERRAELSELVMHHATLEDVFIALTGRQLRDG